MSEKYRFVFSGKIEDGCREEEVKAKLSERFGMSPKKIEKIFSGQPVFIKRGLDQASAARFQQIFAAAGVIGEICTDVESEEAVNPELNSCDDLVVNMRLSGLSDDHRKWGLRHEIYRREERCATLDMDGAWIDLNARRVMAPPKDLRERFAALAHTDDFQVIGSGKVK